jgi:tryptophan-rich sensory protein
VKKSDAIALVLFLVLCQAVGAGAGFATSAAVRDWYPALAKPFFNPPPWVFAPAWTLLYVLMAVAAWRVWRTGPLLFGLQLALNLLWSVLFFGLRSPGLALAEVVLLWLAIAATALSFRPHDKTAAVLMLPYLAWVSFAAVLNAAIWYLN